MIEDGRGAVALEEARRGIDKQNDDIGRLRDRSMTLLSAGGVAAGLIVGFRPDNAPITSWSWLGMAAFVSVAIVATVIAWPQRWMTNQSAAIIMAWVSDQDPDLEVVNRELARHLEDQYDLNEIRLLRLTRTYALAIVMFLLEIALLLLDLRS